MTGDNTVRIAQVTEFQNEEAAEGGVAPATAAQQTQQAQQLAAAAQQTAQVTSALAPAKPLEPPEAEHYMVRYKLSWAYVTTLGSARQLSVNYQTVHSTHNPCQRRQKTTCDVPACDMEGMALTGRIVFTGTVTSWAHFMCPCAGASA